MVVSTPILMFGKHTRNIFQQKKKRNWPSSSYMLNLFGIQGSIQAHKEKTINITQNIREHHILKYKSKINQFLNFYFSIKNF